MESIRDELTEKAFELLKLSAIAILVNVYLLCYLMWESPLQILVLTWAILFTVIVFARIISAHLFFTHREWFSMKSWKYIFLVGVVLSAIMWGVSPLIFFDAENNFHQAMLLMVLSGMSAGAMSSLATNLLAIRLFLLIILLPLIGRLIYEGSGYYPIALLVIFFLIMLLIIARRFHTSYLNVIDMSKRCENETAKLQLSEERFKTVVTQAPVGIFLYNIDLKITEVNEALCDILDAPESFLVGLPLSQLPDKRILPAIEAPLAGKEGTYEGEYKSQYREKQLFVGIRTAPLRDTHQKVVGGIATVSDITERVMIMRHMEHQAKYDELTDTPNRMLLMERISQEIIRFNHYGMLFGLLFLDLDNFKNINDSLGHTVGDSLLIEVAMRLQRVIREEDLIARIGGDEFVILLPDLGIQSLRASSRSEAMAQTIHNTLADVFEIDGHFLNISTSIGIVIMNESEHHADDLLKHADTAMYQAKRDGKGMSRFYQEHMDYRIRRQLAIENALRHAIANNELTLHYQPIVSLGAAKVIAAEALLRWHNRQLGNVTPDEFIPIAEESGLILAIGGWVLEEAIRQFSFWQKDPDAGVNLEKIAINVSSRQFNSPDFVANVTRLLEEYAVAPEHIELELTESVIVSDIEEVSSKMLQLRAMGIGISIDDFGTGYSSLSYLKRLPFSTLKIDRSFTQDILIDKDDMDLITTIITIANSFGMQVVAEGVEQKDQYAFLEDKSCHFFQGFLCSRPLDSASFETLMKNSNGLCRG